MTSTGETGLLLMHADALWLTDSRGRMTVSNEPDGVASPSLFLARGLSSVVWRIGSEVGDEVAVELAGLLEDEPPVTSLEREQAPRHEAEYRSLLDTSADADAGPAWWLPDQEPLPDAVLLGVHDLEVFDAGWAYVRQEYDALAPVAAVVVDGRAVSACRCARRTDASAEAGVDTEEGYTGRGYATSTVGTWAEAVRSTGRLPLYSTSWDNVASRRVAARLDAVPYASDWSLS